MSSMASSAYNAIKLQNKSPEPTDVFTYKSDSKRKGMVQKFCMHY